MISFSEPVTFWLLSAASLLTHADTWLLLLEYSVPPPNVSKLHVLYMYSVVLIVDMGFLITVACSFKSFACSTMFLLNRGRSAAQRFLIGRATRMA